MASTFNAFSSLLGTGEQVAASKKKNNKKKNKPKAEEGANGQAPAPQAPPQKVEKVEKAAPAKAAPASNGTHAETGKAPAPAAVVVDVAEAGAIFERAAREAKSINDKAKLWKDWVKQAGDKSGKGMKYKAADGSYVDFKQALLGCRALEISIEGCLVSGVGAQNEPALQQVLSAFLSGLDGRTCQTVATTISRLATLLENDAPDTVGAAQRAVHNVVAALKRKGEATDESDGNQLSSWVSKLNSLEHEIQKQQSSLARLAKSSNGAVAKEHSNLARELVKLHQEKFDLLQPENLPRPKAGSATTEASLKSLKELQSVVNAHMKEAERAEQPAKGKGAANENSKLASYKREETVLAQQANEVAAQIRTLEAQLRTLRAQQGEIEEKRSKMQQAQRAAFETVSSKPGSARPQQGTLTLAHYQGELELVDSLVELLDPSQHKLIAPEKIAEVQHSRVNCPAEYVYEGSRYLDMVAKCLGDYPQKLSFCQQRISQADKLIQLGGGAGAEKAKKQKEDSEKLFNDTLKACEELMRGANDAVNQVHLRYDAMCRFASEQADSLTVAVKSMDELFANIRLKNDAVLAAAKNPSAHPAPVPAPPVYVPVLAAPAPAAPAPVPAAAPRAAVPAPAPVPAKAVAATEPLATKETPAPDANGSPVPAPVAPVAANKRTTPAKQWGKIEDTPAVSTADESLPTPAEAFGSGEVDGFKPVGGKKNRKKA